MIQPCQKTKTERLMKLLFIKIEAKKINFNLGSLVDIYEKTSEGK